MELHIAALFCDVLVASVATDYWIQQWRTVSTDAEKTELM